jgi:hypothetical protein
MEEAKLDEQLGASVDSESNFGAASKSEKSLKKVENTEKKNAKKVCS